MAFDHGRLSAETALYYIRVDGSLCQKIHRTNLLGLFFKDTDKLFTDDFSLTLRLGLSFQFFIITLLGVHTDKIQIKGAAFSKDFLHLVSFVFTKQTMIHKDTSQLLADGTG